MNNVDASMINVLNKSHPEIFGQYFNRMGCVPNPNQRIRGQASALFRAYASSENFGSFMERYRNWIGQSRRVREAPQSDADEPVEWVVRKKDFNALMFLREKSLGRDYAPLDFHSVDSVDVDALLDVGSLLAVLDWLNKTHDYEVLRKKVR